MSLAGIFFSLKISTTLIKGDFSLLSARCKNGEAETRAGEARLGGGEAFAGGDGDGDFLFTVAFFLDGDFVLDGDVLVFAGDLVLSGDFFLPGDFALEGDFFLEGDFDLEGDELLFARAAVREGDLRRLLFIFCNKNKILALL